MPITIAKAIGINKDTRAFHLLRKELDTAAAIQLGIEALKRIKEMRFHLVTPSFLILPGETTD